MTGRGGSGGAGWDGDGNKVGMVTGWDGDGIGWDGEGMGMGIKWEW